MIRVLHYVGKMDRGGMEMLIMNLYRNVDREQIQFHFAVHGTRNGDFEKEIYSLGGEFFQFPHMRQNPVAYRRAWRNFWQTHKGEYAAFHIHTNSLANIIALEEAYRADVPLRILHSHSSFANRGRLQSLNNFLHALHRKRAAKIATNLIACSDKAAQWLYGGMKLGGHSVEMMNNGVDMQRFSFDAEARDAMRKMLNLEGKKVIGHVGKFITVKNHSFLLDVIKNVYERDKDICALLIGDGPLMESMRKKALDLGIADAVMFLGVRSDIPQLMFAMDIFIMPSLYEGLPVSLIEVQAAGLPSLVSASITSTVKFKSNMEFCALDENVDVWGEKVLSMLSNSGRDTDNSCLIAAGFSIQDTADKYMSLLMGEIKNENKKQS